MRLIGAYTALVFASHAGAQFSGVPFEVIAQSSQPPPGSSSQVFDPFGLLSATVGPNRSVAFVWQSYSSDFSESFFNSYVRMQGDELSTLPVDGIVPNQTFSGLEAARIDTENRIHLIGFAFGNEPFAAATAPDGVGAASVYYRGNDPLPNSGGVAPGSYPQIFGRPNINGEFAINAVEFGPTGTIGVSWLATPEGPTNVFTNGTELFPGTGISVEQPTGIGRNASRTILGLAATGFIIPGEPGAADSDAIALLDSRVPYQDTVVVDRGETYPGFDGRSYRVDSLNTNFFSGLENFEISDRNAVVRGSVSVNGQPADSEVALLLDSVYGPRVILVPGLVIPGSDKVLRGISQALLSDDGNRLFLQVFVDDGEDALLLADLNELTEYPVFSALAFSDVAQGGPGGLAGGITSDGRFFYAFTDFLNADPFFDQQVYAEDGYHRLRRVVGFGDTLDLGGPGGSGLSVVGNASLASLRGQPATNACGSILVTGAVGVSNNQPNGVLLRYDLPHPDRDCSGDLDDTDVLRFIQEQALNDPTTDANADGQLNFFDTLVQLETVDSKR